ncbi:beta-galactosidase-1-like protein 2 isoform X2 [Gigantopelta aegis]|uniref:beta-galactosidase-1-like protein 2 isoform X2 n=1 Tax=Gigantopelta aegis TaxID=1735272 RepID=UPI001B88B4BA|nr:beta-galactosidase-1-like protein 2 isoform X2 [Gigantopelta aegis]
MKKMRSVFFNRSHLKRFFLLICVLVVFLIGRVLWKKENIHHIFEGNGSLRFHEDLSEGDSNHYLTFKNRQFYLGGKPLTILSGAVHYFRSVPEYWKDRLLKVKACGLNTVETYVPWNVHEPVPGHFDFTGMLDIRKYIKLAQEVGLYVILRPGPYICSEWDFGGLPSWLLADPNMRVRTNYHGYQKAAKSYLSQLLSRVVDLQFSNGGPIIAVQVENEYGSYSNDTNHLTFLRDVLHKNGIIELLVTSDNLDGMNRAPFYKDALPMANFKSLENGLAIFEKIRKLDDNFPLMVLEFWTGWFDHWGHTHKGFEIEKYKSVLEGILHQKSSVNFYMFHGGTNFGFMAGANFFDDYKPDVTSYDYDALLSEDGNVTKKYLATRVMLMELVLKQQGIQSLPQVPPMTPKAGYGSVKVVEYLSWQDMLEAIDNTVLVDEPTWMEMLKFQSGFGQSYGFIVYQKQIARGDNLKLSGFVQDRAQILLDAQQVAMVTWSDRDPSVRIQNQKSLATLDIVVENLGRVNFVRFGSNRLNEQRKGINGTVYLDKSTLQKWKVLPLDFNKDYLSRISSSTHWQEFKSSRDKPRMYKTILKIDNEPKDTFLYMKDWQKGVVFINGFNLGRYWDIGPQRTLYVPAPILKKGDNEVLIFEQHRSASEVRFQSTPILG